MNIINSQVRNEFYKDTQGALLVFDVTNRASFDALDSWLAEMRQEIGDPSEMEKVVFCLCANKVKNWVLYYRMKLFRRESDFLSNWTYSTSEW